jgi:hypothetical protein
LVHAEFGNAKFTPSRTGKTEGLDHPTAAFQPANAELAQIGAVAAGGHANDHSAVCPMSLAELRALPGTGSARGDTRVNLLMTHGSLSRKRAPHGS